MYVVCVCVCVCVYVVCVHVCVYVVSVCVCTYVEVSMLRTDCKPDRFINEPLVYKPVSRFVIWLACF